MWIMMKAAYSFTYNVVGKLESSNNRVLPCKPHPQRVENQTVKSVQWSDWYQHFHPFLINLFSLIDKW